MSLVAEMIPLPVSKQYSDSYRGISSQSALQSEWRLVELAKRLQDVIAVF